MARLGHFVEEGRVILLLFLEHCRSMGRQYTKNSISKVLFSCCAISAFLTIFPTDRAKHKPSFLPLSSSLIENKTLPMPHIDADDSDCESDATLTGSPARRGLRRRSSDGARDTFAVFVFLAATLLLMVCAPLAAAAAVVLAPPSVAAPAVAAYALWLAFDAGAAVRGGRGAVCGVSVCAFEVRRFS
ncbi:hypothetical protein BDR26DRAFT_5759 [Obelidium mucronatum]|nr:hypothetical protein BDR26DRAFT_5759 [Obelidium mucronatum]